jgi:hypothetical protein
MARHKTKKNDVKYFHWRCNATKGHNISADKNTTCRAQAPKPGHLAVTAAAAAAAAATRLHCTLLPCFNSCSCTAGQLPSFRLLLLLLVLVLVHDLSLT